MILRGGEFYNDVGNSIGREFIITGDLTAADEAGKMFAILNPFGCHVIITDVILRITTKSTGACTVDVGIAADGTTKNDTLIDGLDINAAAGVFSNLTDAGTNGGIVELGEDQYITASVASGASAGTVGTIIIRAIPV